MYSKKVLRHFNKPKYVGEIKNPDGVAEVGNPMCGDLLKLFIKVKNNKITKVRFKTFGCIAAIAASDVVCKLAEGKTLDKAERITSKDIVNYLGELPLIKIHCSVLGMEALKNAIKNYREKTNERKNK